MYCQYFIIILNSINNFNNTWNWIALLTLSLMYTRRLEYFWISCTDSQLLYTSILWNNIHLIIKLKLYLKIIIWLKNHNGTSKFSCSTKDERRTWYTQPRWIWYRFTRYFKSSNSFNSSCTQNWLIIFWVWSLLWQWLLRGIPSYFHSSFSPISSLCSSYYLTL